MLEVKLTVEEDGTIIAEGPSVVLGYFNDMTLGEVREYLVAQAAEVDERIMFVDEFQEREERVSIRQLMKGKRKK